VISLLVGVALAQAAPPFRLPTAEEEVRLAAFEQHSAWR
jgi:hypothetical protein